jgi:hypothetical protein
MRILIHSLTSLWVNVNVNFAMPRPVWAGAALSFFTHNRKQMFAERS